jgi:glycosyltransferase involved in cell wall biosynthesis
MAKADLHIHSKFSNHPSEWFLKRIGASESYTEPELIYHKAKERGMSFVTLTDHNSIEGALILKEKHPDDFFMGMEATAYFPEDKCKVHILTYGIDENTAAEINEIRKDIYQFRDFILEKKIAYSVAHATYSVNEKLTVAHIEKLILLFDVFEGINGARTKLNNQPWIDFLKNLTPDNISKLRRKHSIEPFGDTPWIKGITGGSDDHAGIFIAKTYTQCEARSVDEYLEKLKNKQTFADGRYSNYHSLAFTIYKIAYDFSKSKSDSFSQSLLSRITESLFEQDSTSLKDRLKYRTYKAFKSKRNENDSLKELYWGLFENMSQKKSSSIEDKLELFYDKLALISDEFFRNLLTSFEKNLRNGDILNVIRNISSSLPGIFLTIPFFSTLKHFNRKKRIVDEVRESLGIKTDSNSKKILWFSDTLSYMNGVSKTVKKIGWLSCLKGAEMKIVTSMSETQIPADAPPNVINLPFIFEFKLPYYENYILKIPSLLRSIKILYSYEPDEVYISTPGPVGLFGLIVAKLLNAKCIGVFHTDFTMQAHEIIEDASMDSLVESYLKWFYSMVDEIQVPTREYLLILENRGYDSSKMKLFRRGVDNKQFSPRETGKEFLREKFEIPEGINLLFAGRISKDKNIDFLIEIFREIKAREPLVNLIICGDGQDFERLKSENSSCGVYFTGEIGHELLADVYSGSDLLVFPSVTDTFGMVVLEAQSCGLPAIVSSKGGPREIIINNITGFSVINETLAEWVEKVSRMIFIIKNDPEKYKQMRVNSRLNAVRNYDWDSIFCTFTGNAGYGDDDDKNLIEILYEKAI